MFRAKLSGAEGSTLLPKRVGEPSRILLRMQRFGEAF
jgi:hypothetical protein